jgi:hypothetical protein
MEDLIDLLFQIDNDKFRVDFTLKPYPKYQYQPPLKRAKNFRKKDFLKAINRSPLNHLYGLNPLGKRNYYYFLFQKKQFKTSKRAGSTSSSISKHFSIK